MLREEQEQREEGITCYLYMSWVIANFQLEIDGI